MTAWEDALNRLEDRLAVWLDRWIEAHPTWAQWLETTLHAHGLHGPAARHLLRTRVVPGALLLAALVLALAVALVLRRVTRGHRRRSRLGRPHPLPR